MSKLGYYPPDTKVRRPMHTGCAGGLVGTGSLGCLLPLLLAVYCAVVLNDMGGPLFWPIISIIGGVIGLIVGSTVGWFIHIARKR